ncbi:MAG: zinc ABC transporter substrate-binding protein [Sulfitobacter sp.]
MFRYLIPFMLLGGAARADVPKVVTDIAPVYALVSQVMEGVGTPDIVVPRGASPHHYAMRPSQARALSGAEVVVWVGHGLTPWLEEPIESLAQKAKVVELMDVEGVHLLPFREGALFESGGHDHEHEHEHGEEEEGVVADPHVWLDPDNGIIFLNAIAAELALLDPENADVYAANARAGIADITALDREIDAQLADVRGIPFVVLHDGFHYFEDHFAIEAIAAIAASDAQTPGGARVRDLRDDLKDRAPRCAFSEPQVGTALVKTVTEGVDVKIGILDPVGSQHPLDAALYTALLRSMADAFVTCLRP